MSLEKIIDRIKKAACVGLTTIALMGGIARETKAQENLDYEIIRLSNFHIGTIDFATPVTSVYSINNQGEVAGCLLYIPIGKEPYKKPFLYNLCNEKIFSEFKNIPESFFGCAKAISNSPDSYPPGRIERFVILEEQFIDDHGYSNYLKSHIAYIDDPYGGIYGCLPPFILSSFTFPLEFKAQDINSKGEVVGEQYAFVGRSTINLCPDSNHCEAYGINDDSIIVGCSRDNSFLRQPVFWELDEKGDYKEIKLPVPEPWVGGCALDINKKRQIIGYLLGDCGRPGCKEFPFLWDGESVIDLSPLTKVYSINNLRQIVGTIGGNKAGLWQDGIVIDLNEFIPQDSNKPSDWDYLYEAISINDSGQIIGHGYLNYDKGAGRWRMPYLFLMNKKDLEGDLNKDGIVNLRDLSELAEHWLEER
jgi:hypothetical protein